MVTITHLDGSTFTSNEVERVVAEAHTTGKIKSVRATERREMSRFFEILEVVDTVFCKITGIQDLDDPSF